MGGQGWDQVGIIFGSGWGQFSGCHNIKNVQKGLSQWIHIHLY